ncbi:MAG: mechanosensitive ion channel [Saprospiraceae bacterium]|nr:mechanosensitive ion channel [Saprospiraceae bacterium]
MINLLTWDGAKYLSEILGKIMLFLPNLVSAIVLLIIGFLIAKIVSKIISKALSRTKVDNLSANIKKIDFVDKFNIDFKISSIIGKFFYYFIVLIFLVVSTDILNMPMLSNLIVSIINFVPNLLIAFILLVGGLLVANWLKVLVFNIAKSLAMPSATIISNLVFYFVLINVFISVMLQIKVNVEFLSTNLSLVIGGIVFAFALAYGLASKPILANIISSFYLNNKYQIGDYVIIGNYEGEIIEKDNFNIILHKDNTKIVIPLSKLSDNEVVVKMKN